MYEMVMEMNKSVKPVFLISHFLFSNVVDDTTLDIVPVPDLQNIDHSDTESVLLLLPLHQSLNSKFQPEKQSPI
ncbi:UNVERIFIED_CONTAM: hypothetical protein NCL1_05118 [Trichonephila clavipes]